MAEVKGCTAILLSALLFVIIEATVKGCHDVLPNCKDYADSYCAAPNIAWAMEHCKKRCNLCDYLPHGKDNCFDIHPNCEDLQYSFDNFCQGKHKTWAMKRCRFTCNSCSSTKRETKFMASVAKVEKVVPVNVTDICQDVLDNCLMFPDSACEWPDWSLDNCRKRCNLCEEAPLTCVDKVSNCQPDICTGKYTNWARQFCPVACNLCGGTTTPNPPTTAKIPITTLLPRLNWQPIKECNNLWTGCETYPDSVCLDKLWVIPRCKQRCNICGDVYAKCVDRTDCTEFRYSMTCTGYYKDWAKQYCTKTCGFCKSDTVSREKRSVGMESAPQQAPFEAGFYPGSTRGDCTHKGRTYKPGESWVTDCKWRCTCGQDICVGICWSWDLTSTPSCYMNPPAPGKCCPTINCPSNVKLNYPAGYTEE